jgi:hypothetical protein
MTTTAPSTTACGPSCGCGSTPPIACSLGSDDLAARIDQWTTILEATVTGRSAVDGGLRLALCADVDLGPLTRLVVAERGCCAFYRFALTVDERGIALEVTAPDEAQGVLASLFGEAA